MSYYPEQDSDIRDKVRVVSDLSNYATKKELDRATDVVPLIQLLRKISLIWKIKLSRLGINELVNVPTSLNNLKIKVGDLYVGKLKSIDLRRFNTLKTQINNLEKKIPDPTTLIHILVW